MVVCMCVLCVCFSAAKHSVPRWLMRCFLRWSDCANLLPQISHANGLSPVWPRMCFFRLPASVNARKHTMHSNLAIQYNINTAVNINLYVN